MSELCCIRGVNLLICVIVICASDVLIVNTSIKMPNCLLVYYMYMYWLSASIFLILAIANLLIFYCLVSTDLCTLNC